MKLTTTFKWIGITAGIFSLVVMYLDIIAGKMILAGLMFLCFILFIRIAFKTRQDPF